ncbi:MAG: SufE family protein [Verrucomicrobiota bacterium]
MSYPARLQSIIDLFESLPDQAKRENLIAMADSAKKFEPQEGQTYTLEDVRKDEECTDTVGIYLTVQDQSQCNFHVSLGPQVQTLTRAMTSILCKGLDGLSPDEIMEIPADFVPKIVGADLVRQRSQTTYYVLSRMKGVCKVWLNRKRAAESESNSS